MVSGGGSGHEPTHAGFVGEGALDAIAAGAIFASPSTKQIYSAIKAVESPKGTLIIVKITPVILYILVSLLKELKLLE